MKPSVISSAAANATSGNGAPTASSTSSSNGITIPINHEYGTQHQQHPLYQQQQAYSPQQQQQQHHQQQQQAHPNTSQGFSAGSPSNTRQYPAHFQQGFGFEPDMDDMFPRSRLGRLHDPFSSFATRKRCGNDPNSAATDGFSHYFEDDPDFSFPQFGSLGRRRAGAGANTSSVDPHTGLPTHGDSDFFNRLPSEFRQYIPEGFGQRRSTAPTAQHQPQQQYYQQPHQQQQHYVQPGSTPPKHNGGVGVGIPQSPIKKVCDAAIQTEDPAKVAERSEVDGHHMQLPMQQQQDYLNQHNFRNTVDMGVKSMPEMSQEHGPRSHSAPPQEQLQQQQQQQQHQQQHQPSESSQYSTQTSPPVSNPGHQQPPIYQKVYYAPQQQAHPQQKQKSPPTTPQTPGGTYVRTIPIFVEGRSEPIINSHKEIPNQNGTGTSATASASARHVPQQQHPQQTQQQYYQSQPQQTPHPQQQQHRPTPLNTQQQQQQPEATNASGLPPQTPHTMDSINKIQDIQRDVLDLMSKVENFAGKRRDKEYAYLDEMLTRNLLKLDTIDTNGKDSIRLARKEAIKCIQASINVLEAKAEENARAAEQLVVGEESADSQQTGVNDQQTEVTKKLEAVAVNEEAEPMSEQLIDEQQPVDATQIQEPIPLPPPEGMQIDAEVTNATRTATSPAKELQAVLVLPTVESTESKME